MTHELAASHLLATPRVEFVTEFSAFESLAAKWESLNRKQSDHGACFFQSYAWSRHVASVRKLGSPERYRLLIATLWREKELVGIWPLSLQRGQGVWIVRNLDDPFGQFAGFLSENRTTIACGVKAILDALRAKGVADGVLIDAVTAGTPLHEALMRAGARAIGAQPTVYVDLRPYASAEEFRRSINSKTRKNLRNLHNRLVRVHPVEHVISSDPIESAPMMQETFAARLQWMHRKGKTSPAFRDADFANVVAGLGSAKGVELLCFRFGTEKHFVSAQWGFIYAGRYYAYISAKNPAYDEFSPGRMQLGMVLEACVERGIEVAELMPPASDYKLGWNGCTRELEALAIPFSLKGRFALNLLAGWAVPQARKLSRALPEFLRKQLVRRINRS